MKERLGLVILAALSLSACNEQKDTSGSADMSSYQGRSYSVLGQLRPKADASVMKQIHDEEQARQDAAREAALAEMRAREAQQNQQEQRNLPGVGQTNLANLPSVGGPNDYSAQAQQAQAQMQAQQQAQAQQIASSWAAPIQTAPQAPQGASYGINYTQPSPGFVPPPPAVSLSTQAVPMPMPYAMPPNYNPYANPYANPYGGQDPNAPPAKPSRSKDSLFGSSDRSASSSSGDDEEEQPKKKKKEPVQIITPTGMEPRSAFKQRDELKMLWKAAVANSLGGINADPKFAEGIAKIEVGLPADGSKGSLSVQQRQIDALFKNTNQVDKKIFPNVKKVQTDLVQAYYRYLYSYNKFFLTQQQVQARKQELDCAESQSERQRATLDLAQATQEADGSKEDMRSSQGDLVAIVGANAARTVIKAVSGVAPSPDQLAQAEPAQAQGQGGDGGIGGIFNVFGFGKKQAKKEDNSSAGTEEVQVVAENKGKEAKEGKDKKEKKHKDKGDKDKGEKGDKADKGGKQQIAAKPDVSASSKSDAPEPVASAPPPQAQQGPVSFELKEVKTTPRKSMLKVIVKNAGSDSFNFDADSLSVSEGNSKLSAELVSAEFDSTVVQTGQEVAGTITIFGRPWNDKITVSLVSGKRPILMHH